MSAPRAAALLSHGLRFTTATAASSAPHHVAGGKALRSTTASVANRLCNQEAVRLDEHTPQTLAGALADSHQARVVTELQAPHRVVHVSKASR
jgi:hypothetical protein